MSGAFLVQYATSGRSGCLACKQMIQKGELRLGTPLSETGRFQWHHWSCLSDAELGPVRQQVQGRGPKVLAGQEELTAEDQERVQRALQGAGQPAAAAGGAAARRAAAARAAAEELATEDEEEEEEEEDDDDEEDYEPAPRTKTPRKGALAAGRRMPSRRMAEKRRLGGDDEDDSDYDPRGDSRRKKGRGGR